MGEMAKDLYLCGQVAMEVDTRTTVIVMDMQHQSIQLPLVVLLNPDRFRGIQKPALLHLQPHIGIETTC